MINAAGVLQDFVPTLWALFLIPVSEDQVYYLTFLKKNKALSWSRLESMKDCSNMLVFSSEKEAKEAIKIILKTQSLPCETRAFDLEKIQPEVDEDGLIWYHTISGKMIKIKKGKK